MAAVKALGYASETQDEADALGVLHSVATGFALEGDGDGPQSPPL